ncbi:MAG TPA: hypothetical protein VMG12_39760 [Polyangiaceae bacterium]|nr:hypothetical protein [Polyangiaceae bacterium]
MRPWSGASLLRVCAGGAALAFACADVTTEQVTKDVCYSELRWVGGRRGSEEMYPGRDCVGCHLENDGPQLMLGGTLYAHLIPDRELAAELQTGTDCFGLEGVTVRIRDASLQLIELTTNRAGNFFIEGNPNDFEKPFQVEIQMGDIQRAMGTRPLYGGCARCHDPAVPSAPEQGLPFDDKPTDPDYRNGTARIGVPDYRPAGLDTPSVVEELMLLVGIEP